MKKQKRVFALHFVQLMFSVFVLFFLSVGLGKESADLITYMNNSTTTKKTVEWVWFLIGAPIATAVWCVFWLWFKSSEKKCIDWFNK